MADSTLPNLPSGAAIADADLSYWVQNNVDVKQPASALKTYIGATSSGGIGININTLTSSPLVPDGETSNVPMLQSLAPVLQGICPEIPVPVFIAVGTPTVITLNVSAASGGYLTDATHYLKPNQSFYFTITPGGSLPSGISLNTPYYITAANMTATTFTFSATNNYGVPTDLGLGIATTEGPTVNTTGSLVGTASIVLTGRDINITIPSGAYFGGIYADSVPNVDITPNGITRIRYFAYGAIFDNKVTFGTPVASANGFMSNVNWVSQVFDYVTTTPNEVGGSSGPLNGIVTLQTPANAANYYVGQWIAIFNIDLQNTLGVLRSGPANNQAQEYKRITAINVGAGTLTLDGPLKWVYLSTTPNLVNATGGIGGGTALIAQMNPAWDCEIEVHGARWIGQPSVTAARRVLLSDCIYQGYSTAPGVVHVGLAQSYIMRNCRFGPGGAPGASAIQVDKMMEYLEYDTCTSFNQQVIECTSPSLHLMVFKRHHGSILTGTPRQLRISDSLMDALYIGPFFSVTDSIEIENSRFTYVDMVERQDASAFITPTNDMQLVPNWTFSNGTFTRNITGVSGNALDCMGWQVMGAKMFFTDAGQTYAYYQNMGAPFTILNVYMDNSGNFSFDTTLSAVPTRQGSHTVTFTAPSTVNWTANGQSNGTAVCFTTTGTLPTGLSTGTIYYIVGVATNTFQVSTSVGGSAVTFTGSGTATTTVYTNPLCFSPHPCARFTSIGNSGCPQLLDWNGAVDEPLFSRVRRAFGGIQTTSTGFQLPHPKIWGNLDRMIVNVVKAGSSGTLTISSPGFPQPNLGSPATDAANAFSQVIDVTVAGKRTVTNAAVTGSAGGDSLSAYANWVAGPLLFTWASPPGTMTASPLVTFEMYTDQGITRFSNMMGAPIATGGASNIWQYIDAGVFQSGQNF